MGTEPCPSVDPEHSNARRTLHNAILFDTHHDYLLTDGESDATSRSENGMSLFQIQFDSISASGKLLEQ